MGLPLEPPISPMLAAPAADIAAAVRTAGTDITWEPKFDGFRCLVWRDGAALMLRSRTGKPLERYFPELIGPLRALLPQHCVRHHRHGRTESSIYPPQSALWQR